GLGAGIALLLARPQTPVVALAHRLDRGVQAEDSALALALGAALAAGVEEAGVVGRCCAAEAIRLVQGKRPRAVIEAREARNRILIDRQLRLHRRDGDPVPLLDLLA